jgi:hypothetical protein
MIVCAFEGGDYCSGVCVRGREWPKSGCSRCPGKPQLLGAGQLDDGWNCESECLALQKGLCRFGDGWRMGGSGDVVEED